MGIDGDYPIWAEYYEIYVKRSIALAIIGAVAVGLAVALVLFTAELRLLSKALLAIVQWAGLDPIVLKPSKKAIKSSAAMGKIQIIAIIIAGFLFIVLNIAVGIIQHLCGFIKGPDEAFEKSIREGMVATGKEIVTTGIPMVVFLFVGTTVMSLIMFKQGSVSGAVMRQAIWQTIIIIPMVIFYEIAVKNMTQ